MIEMQITRLIISYRGVNGKNASRNRENGGKYCNLANCRRRHMLGQRIRKRKIYYDLKKFNENWFCSINRLYTNNRFLNIRERVWRTVTLISVSKMSHRTIRKTSAKKRSLFTCFSNYQDITLRYVVLEYT